MWVYTSPLHGSLTTPTSGNGSWGAHHFYREKPGTSRYFQHLPARARPPAPSVWYQFPQPSETIQSAFVAHLQSIVPEHAVFPRRAECSFLIRVDKLDTAVDERQKSKHVSVLAVAKQRQILLRAGQRVALPAMFAVLFS